MPPLTLSLKKSAMDFFVIAQLRFELEAVDSVQLPGFRGTAFRKVLARAFRQVACALKSAECNDCPLSSSCVYAYLFETQVTEDFIETEKQRAVPHPFVLCPPFEERHYYRPGEQFVFMLTLTGKAEKYIPYFIYAFSEIGKRGTGKGRGRFRVYRVINCQTDTDIYNNNGKIDCRACQAVSWRDIVSKAGDLNAGDLTMRFSTPTRIKHRGAFVRNPEFHVLMQNLLRRISELSYFHCSHEINLDFKGLIKKADNVNVKERKLSWESWGYSDAEKSMMKLEGFTGEITFTGDFTDFLPFIILGQYIHVGKGTSFGLGRYEIV